MKEYLDPDIAVNEFEFFARWVEKDPDKLADLVMHLNKILNARGFTPQMLSLATGFDQEAIKKALLPSNKNPDEEVLVAVMKSAGFDLKNWSDTKRSLEKITTKYDEVLRKLSKT